MLLDNNTFDVNQTRLEKYRTLMGVFIVGIFSSFIILILNEVVDLPEYFNFEYDRIKIMAISTAFLILSFSCFGFAFAEHDKLINQIIIDNARELIKGVKFATRKEAEEFADTLNVREHYKGEKVRVSYDYIINDQWKGESRYSIEIR